jgi:hypothetical protein
MDKKAIKIFRGLPKLFFSSTSTTFVEWAKKGQQRLFRGCLGSPMGRKL